jgi:hypothetical protein
MLRLPAVRPTGGAGPIDGNKVRHLPNCTQNSYSQRASLFHGVICYNCYRLRNGVETGRATLWLTGLGMFSRSGAAEALQMALHPRLMRYAGLEVNA